MMTVNDVSKLTGVSIRTLQYYDSIGLLKPKGRTEAGYRLYDDMALERLQQILLFKELEFSLQEIRQIIDSENFDREKALEQQIELLTLKKQHIENLIDFALELKNMGENKMDFKVFDTKKIDEYAKKAKEQWGNTAEFEEYEEKVKDFTDEQKKDTANSFMLLFAEFGRMKNLDVEDEVVQKQVMKLHNYISANYFNCSKEILAGIGSMYSAGGEFTQNIDSYGGEGTAVFVAKAIEKYCA